MNKLLKYIYCSISVLFVVFTVFEIFVYMKMDSNYVGIFYLFLNFFVMFLLLSITINYDKGNKSVRISKNIIVIGIGVFASFILSIILPFIFKYTDSSYLFNDSIFVVSKILKPILYVVLGVVSVVELKKKINVSDYKVK